MIKCTMHRKKILSTNKYELNNYIDGSDIYNSKLLSLMSADPTISRVKYKIEQYAFRPDLICKDFYGSMDYYGLFLLTCGVKIDDFWRGNILYLIPPDVLATVISSI